MKTRTLNFICVAALIFCAIGPTKAQCHIDDWNALKELYEKTDGLSWSFNTTWIAEFEGNNSPSSSCSLGALSGVNLDLDGRVERLYLYNKGLSGYIPRELKDLSHLTCLILANNQLSDSIPNELGCLSNLKELDFSNNQLIGNIPVELGNLINLDRLYLDDNQLNGTIPSELGNLGNLNRLYLDNNQLSGNIPSELGNLTNLNRLQLNNNQLSGTIPADLGNLRNLSRLYLYSNQLSGSIPAELEKLQDLDNLRLRSNQLSGCYAIELVNWCNRFNNYDISFGNNLDVPFLDICSAATGVCASPPSVLVLQLDTLNISNENIDIFISGTYPNTLVFQNLESGNSIQLDSLYNGYDSVGNFEPGTYSVSLTDSSGVVFNDTFFVAYACNLVLDSLTIQISDSCTFEDNSISFYVNSPYYQSNYTVEVDVLSIPYNNTNTIIESMIFENIDTKYFQIDNLGQAVYHISVYVQDQIANDCSYYESDDDDDTVIGGFACQDFNCLFDTVINLSTNYEIELNCQIFQNPCNGIDQGVLFCESYFNYPTLIAPVYTHYYNNHLIADSTIPALIFVPPGEYIIQAENQFGCSATDTVFLEECDTPCVDSIHLSSNLSDGVYYADDIIICSASMDGEIKLLAGSKNDNSEYIELQTNFEALGNFLFEAINVDCDNSDN